MIYPGRSQRSQTLRKQSVERNLILTKSEQFNIAGGKSTKQRAKRTYMKLQTNLNWVNYHNQNALLIPKELGLQLLQDSNSDRLIK